MARKFTILTILFFALILRVYHLNWDENNHLHPDERFLTMVGNAMRVPNSLSSYLDTATSPMNPANVGYSFYVYGTLPVVLNKIIAVASNTDNYSAFTLLGRLLSAFADVFVAYIVFRTAELINRSIKVGMWFPQWAALSYTLFALPIQLSHYFAVDTFLNLFAAMTVYAVLRAFYARIKPAQYIWMVIAGASYGAALGSKVSAIYLAPLILAFFVLLFMKWRSVYIFISLFIFAVAGYLSLRLCAPYYFQSGNIFFISINPDFLKNITSLKSFEGYDVWYPPAVQWMSTVPFLFALKNLVLTAMGVVPFAFFMIGALDIVYRFVSHCKKEGTIHGIQQYSVTGYGILGMLLMYICVFFTYQSVQFVKAARYFIVLYPYLALITGIGIVWCLTELKKVQIRPKGASVVIVVLLLIWPLAFMSIYVQRNSRVQASIWIYNNLPSYSTILTEHWDDGLPLPMEDTKGKTYVYEQLPVFDPDNPEKWQKMNDLLQSGDYYILTSNRGWGSIPKVPWKYPRMSVYYADLFGGRTGYKYQSSFTSPPSLRYLGIPLDFPDQWIDESMTVYDHPQVVVFKNAEK